MVYVQEKNYPSTTIHHRHNKYTILGTWSHANTRAPPNANTDTIPKYRNKYIVAPMIASQFCIIIVIFAHLFLIILYLTLLFNPLFDYVVYLLK